MLLVFVAVALFLQCANVYVMYFTEYRYVLGQRMHARLRALSVQEDVEAPAGVVERSQTLFAWWCLRPLPGYVQELSDLAIRPWNMFWHEISYLVFGTMFLGAALIFGLGLRHYDRFILADWPGVVFFT